MARAGAGAVLATIGVAVAASAVGLFVAFFTAGVGLFSDGGGPASRYYIAGMGAAVLFALGFLGGLLVPSRWRTLGIWLGVPVVPVVLFFQEIGGRPDWLAWLALTVVFVLSFIAASLLGAWFGARVRLKSRMSRDLDDGGSRAT